MADSTNSIETSVNTEAFLYVDYPLRLNKTSGLWLTLQFLLKHSLPSGLFVGGVVLINH